MPHLLHNYHQSSITHSLCTRKHSWIRTESRKQEVSISKTGTNLDSKLEFFFNVRLFWVCFVNATPPSPFTISFSALTRAWYQLKIHSSPRFPRLVFRREIMTESYGRGRKCPWKFSQLYKTHPQADSNWLANHSSLECEPLGFLLELFEMERMYIVLNLMSTEAAQEALTADLDIVHSVAMQQKSRLN